VLRVLLDANVLISALLSLTRPDATVTRVVRAGVGRRYVILFPEQVLIESTQAVATTPYLSDRIPPTTLRSFMTSVQRAAEALPPLLTSPAISRDPNDNYLLAHALASQADYLVTGDKDLLALAGAGFPFRIVSPAAFLAVLEEAGLA